MNNFLNYLNTTDADRLSEIAGITRHIAENLIAARPFNAVDDCLKAKGMTKNLLNRLQSAFEAQEKESESRTIIKVDDEAARVEQTLPTGESANEQEPSFLVRLGRAFMVFLRALIKLISVLLLLGSIGAALYYGLPILNEKIILPIEQNTTSIGELQMQLDETNKRLLALETSIEAHSASLTQLDEIQLALENKIQQSQDGTLLELKQEVMMTRALDLLGRARLYLAQSNFGMAKEDVQSARDVLADLYRATSNEAFGQAVARLDLALGNLPAFPVVASGDLEIAWQILMAGVPVNLPTATPTAMPLPTFTATPAQVSTSTPTPFPPPSVGVTSTP